jgi:hypothetical protein
VQSVCLNRKTQHKKKEECRSVSFHQCLSSSTYHSCKKDKQAKTGYIKKILFRKYGSFGHKTALYFVVIYNGKSNYRSPHVILNLQN